MSDDTEYRFRCLACDNTVSAVETERRLPGSRGVVILSLTTEVRCGCIPGGMAMWREPVPIDPPG